MHCVDQIQHWKDKVVQLRSLFAQYLLLSKSLYGIRVLSVVM